MCDNCGCCDVCDLKRSSKVTNILHTDIGKPDIMAPAYKLTYFPISGLGEPIRFLLSYGGIEFEDFRFELENWPSIKDTMPFGQVPVLEVDRKRFYQTVAISRYLAKQVKLVGKNDLEDLEIDAVVDTVTDLRLKIATFYYEKDSELRESKKGPLFKETVPYYLERLNAMAKENDGHLAVGRLTWADLFFVSLLYSFNHYAENDLVAEYPDLQNVRETVLELPSIKEWIAKRPAQEY